MTAKVLPLPDSAKPASSPPAAALPGARMALVLLLSINMFNYIDRQVLAAVVPAIEEDPQIFPPGLTTLSPDSSAWLQTFIHFLAPAEKSLSKAMIGLLAMAFMVAYMVT